MSQNQAVPRKVASLMLADRREAGHAENEKWEHIHILPINASNTIIKMTIRRNIIDVIAYTSAGW